MPQSFTCSVLAAATIFLLTAVLGGRLSFLLSDEADAPSSINLTAQTCVVMRGPRGLEDFVKLRDGLVLASELDSARLWFGPLAGKDSGGNFSTHIWAITIGDSTQGHSAVRLPLKNYPSGVTFHPHGLGLLDDRLLFVVNHAYGHGGERVDVFAISRVLLPPSSRANVSADIDPLGSSNAVVETVELIYENSVDMSALSMGTLNDVVPVAPAEFYATQWSPFPHPANGLLHTTLIDLRDIMYYMFNPFFKWTRIFHCQGLGSEAKCLPVGPPGVAWNGIAASRDGSQIFVSDIFDDGQGLYHFVRDSGGARELRTPPNGNSALNLPLRKIDNLYYSDADHIVWGAGASRFIESAKLMEVNHGNWSELTGPRRGEFRGIRSFAVRADLKTGKVERYVHDGQLLFGWSAAIPVGHHLIIGSFLDDGVLVCDLEKTSKDVLNG